MKSTRIQCKLLLAASAIFLAASLDIQAQSLVLSWNLTNANSAVLNPMPATATNEPTLATSGFLSIGSGVTASNVSPAFRAAGFDQTSLENALLNNDYLAFSISPLQSLNFEQVTFVVKTATSATFNYSLFSSATGFALEDALFSNNNGTTSLLQTNVVDLTGFSELQNLASELEFRLYGFRAAAGSTAFEFANGSGTVDVGIYATAVPEPSTVALLAVALGSLAFAGRKRIAALRTRA
jgi:hypothetical protein